MTEEPFLIDAYFNNDRDKPDYEPVQLYIPEAELTRLREYVSPRKVNYDKMRLEAFKKFIEAGFKVKTEQTVRDPHVKEIINVNDCLIFGPTSRTELKTELDLIKKMEQEEKE